MKKLTDGTARNGGSNVNGLRLAAKRTIDTLSEPRLRVAADFLSYLEERENNPATDELLRIPGFLRALKRGERQIAQGKITPVGRLRRKP